MDSQLKENLKNISLVGNDIADKQTRAEVQLLINIVERLATENEELLKEIQKLSDENNRLKGEQGKPKIRPQKKGNDDISSEDERNRKKKKKKNDSRNRPKKKTKIKVDRTVECHVDRSLLPDDAIFKGYETVIVQDLLIQTDNIEFKKPIYCYLPI